VCLIKTKHIHTSASATPSKQSWQTHERSIFRLWTDHTPPPFGHRVMQPLTTSHRPSPSPSHPHNIHRWACIGHEQLSGIIPLVHSSSIGHIPSPYSSNTYPSSAHTCISESAHAHASFVTYLESSASSITLLNITHAWPTTELKAQAWRPQNNIYGRVKARPHAEWQMWAPLRRSRRVR
jgi:hypothetical protein